MATTYAEAVEQTIIAGEQLHQIINGTSLTEVTVEDGSKIPTVRKALIDNFYFKSPLDWQSGQQESVFNQLRKFIDGTLWYAPSATTSSPLNMGETPVGDNNWRVYTSDVIAKINKFSGTIIEPAEWKDIPKHDDLDLGDALNIQAEALTARSELLRINVREMMRRSHADAGNNLVDGSFEDGCILEAATDVAIHWSSGKAYSGEGPYPQTVNADTNPIAGGFTLRDEPFAWKVGVSMVKGAVYHYYNKYGYVLPLIDRVGGQIMTEEPDYGLFDINAAVIDLALFTPLDGSIDNTDDIKNAAKLQNHTGKKIVGNGTAKVRSSASDPITFNGDVDFSNLRTVCSTVDVGSEPSSVIYRYTQDYIDLTSSVIKSEFVKGTNKIPSLAGKNGFVRVESSNVATYQKVGTDFFPVRKQDPVQVLGQGGRLRSPLYFSYTTASNFMVRYKPFVRPINANFGIIDVTQARVYALVEIKRNNVAVSISADTGTNYSALYTPIAAYDCCNLTITGMDCPTVGTDSIIGYALQMNMVDNILAQRMLARHGWSGVNGNYFRGLTITKSSVYTVSSHVFSSDISVYDCEIYKEFSIHGHGYLSISNVRHVVDPNDGFTSANLVICRRDYGASWDGDISVSDVTVTLPANITSYTIATCDVMDNYQGLNVGEENQYIPNIDVDKIGITSPLSSGLQIFGFITRGVGVSQYIKYKVMPKYIKFKNVDIRTNNTCIWRPFFNNWDMSGGPDYIPVVNDPKMLITFDDVYYNPPLSQLDDVSNSDGLGIKVFPTPDSLVFKQIIRINNSDHHSIHLRTYRRLDIEITNSDIVYPRQKSEFIGDNTTSDASSSIDISDCTLIDINPFTTSYKIGFSLSNCTFEWSSYYGSVLAVPTTIFNANFRQSLKSMVNCRIPVSTNANETLGDTGSVNFTKQPAGYFNSTVFQTYPGSP